MVTYKGGSTWNVRPTVTMKTMMEKSRGPLILQLPSECCVYLLMAADSAQQRKKGEEKKGRCALR